MDTVDVESDAAMDALTDPVANSLVDGPSVSARNQLLHAFAPGQLAQLPTSELANHSLTPFAHKISPLAHSAATNLQAQLQFLSVQPTAKGKMYGVLVVRCNDEYRYLISFSGKLDGRWHKPGFVPPPFDTKLADKLLQDSDVKIKALDDQIEADVFAHQLIAIDTDTHALKATFEREHQALCDKLKHKKSIRRARRQQLANQPTTQSDTNLGTDTESIIKALDAESSEDRQSRKAHRRQFNEQLQLLENRARKIKFDREKLKTQRQDLSRRTQIEYFNLFRLLDRHGNKVNLASLADGQLPPAGTGECAGAKLLAFALSHNLEPVAMAEFWWGPTPSGEVRHHGNYYPCCRSKCGLLIPALLGDGSSHSATVNNSSVMDSRVNFQFECARNSGVTDAEHISVLFEDDQLAVVDKPAGVLSVPGKSTARSIHDWAAEHWPDASGPLLVHRLDMDTSGALLIAKNHQSYVDLQRQFAQRTVQKTYIALVAGLPDRVSGQVDLPLRVDLDDRPRQMVCHSHGKRAVTDWRVLDSGEWGISDNKQMLITRLKLQPLTGRTHQLRLHCASVDGLDTPIIGDRLYGKGDLPPGADFKRKLPGSVGGGEDRKSDRMMLHAASLSFVHPRQQQRLTIESVVPF